MRPVDGGEVSPFLPQPHSSAQADMGTQKKSSSPFPATDTKKGRRSVLFLFPPRVQPPPIRPETGLPFSSHPPASTARSDSDSWRNNRGDKSGITRDEPGHTGKTRCNFIAWDENRRGGKSLPFSSLLDGVRVWPESLFRLSTHHGSGSVGGVLPHLGKPTVGPLAVVFFHR